MPDLKTIKRNTNDFSLTETIASLANNREYKSGYLDLINGKTNDRTYFWECLSAVGEEVGEVIYENVLNYINNVANINTCKLKALTSIAKVLGIREFAILKNLDAIPNDILNMMDIFSINRAYLLNPRYFNTDFVRDLLYFTLDEESLADAEDALSGGDVSAYSVIGAILPEKYEEYVERVFFETISNKLFQHYGSLSGDIIYKNLAELGEFSETYDLATTRNFKGHTTIHNIYGFEDPNSSSSSKLAFATMNYTSMLDKYKKAYNVSPGFNEHKIVDDIENGLDFLDNYQGGELSVLNLEIEERAKPKFLGNNGYAYNRPDTRYSYYNEIEVKNYAKFVNDMYLLNSTNLQYAAWNPLILSNNFSPYVLDRNFSDITLSANVELSTNIQDQMLSVQMLTNGLTSLTALTGDLTSLTALTGETLEFSSFVYNWYGNPDFVYGAHESGLEKDIADQNIVRMVARILKDICFSIVSIRERLKTQAQRNYMTGTKLLVEYILDEYLLNSLIYNYGVDREKALANNSFGVKLVEYIDSTEYYNIGSLLDEFGFMKTSVNQPYYRDLSGGGQAATTTGIGLVANKIRDFYLSTLNIKSDYIKTEEDYFDFMSAVYEVGVSKTYVGTDGALVFDKSGLDDSISFDLGLKKLCADHSMTTRDYEYIKSREFINTPEGYKYLNYDAISGYWNELSAKALDVSANLELYNSRLSTRIEQQTELALKYHGTDIAYYPWYNYKNQDFPTFQAHPYLYNFIEHDDESYPIENAFYGNANADLIYELQSENLSIYLSSYGNIRRVWRNSNFDYSGYKSRYENSTHSYGSSNSNGLYSVTHYDGLFYPPAIELYKKYVKNEIHDPNLSSSGLALLSDHMVLCVDEDCYFDNSYLDISDISSMWHYYSHLGLTRSDRKFIVEQLLRLSADIMNIADAKYRIKHGDVSANVEEPYDIYKYGLDYNKNSYILVKRYLNSEGVVLGNDSVSQKAKRETPGELWFRFNSHPIAFPLFIRPKKVDGVDISQYQQACFVHQSLRPDSIYEASLNPLIINNVRKDGKTTRYGTKTGIENVYDFDLANGGRYFVYAIENPSVNVSEKSYKNSVTLAASLYQSRSTDFIDATSEKTQYRLLANGPTFLYPTNDGPRLNFRQETLSGLSSSEYEFDGFFQNKRRVYAAYFKRNVLTSGILNSINLNVIEYPGSKAPTTNVDSMQFCFENSLSCIPLNNEIAYTEADAKIKIGFAEKRFSLVVTNKLRDGADFEIQDFIGKNSVNGPEHGYGKTNYVSATLDDDPNKFFNSFDRFDELISIHDIIVDQNGNEDARETGVYALNSDASYIPLYYGVDGQNLHQNLKDTSNHEPISYNKDWHSGDDLSNEVTPRESIELLGYSFQDISSLAQQTEADIYYDSNARTYTNVDGNNLLTAALRVYEDFELSDHVYQSYNRGGVYFRNPTTKKFDKISVTFDNISIPGLSAYDGTPYRVLLLNASNGKDKNPILAGPFSDSTFSSPYYDSTPTKYEETLLSTHFKNSFDVRIVGTPNPFNDFDTTIGTEYSNHIFNISGVSVILTKPTESHPSYKIDVVMTPRDDEGNASIGAFAIQSNSLILFIYKDTLDEYQKYHYMTPFPRHPFNAAMSAWNQPWKDSRYPWMYLDGYDGERDGWKDEKNYLDMRNQVLSSNYRAYLSANGVNVSALVGNVDPEKYYDRNDRWRLTEDAAEKFSGLSIMENIDVSSCTSLDDLYYLSRGHITFKISEEERFNQDARRYPPLLIDCLLYEKFGSTVKERGIHSVFDLSNTFIFQLDDPLSIANKIGNIAIPYGSQNDEYDMVYEDYLSSFISVDIGGENSYHYLELLVAPPNDVSEDVLSVLSGLSSSEELSINVDGAQDKNAAVEEYLSSHYLYPERVDRSKKYIVTDYQLTSVKPEDIEDYLKLYVCWRKQEHPESERHDEIELFFNYQNLFSTPYTYRTKDGRFAVEFKKSTYLNLQSGQDGYLYVILQFKYYDSSGDLCGVRDLPVLTYHIYNVSDDKPKFIIVKTFEIDNRNGLYTYPDDSNVNDVYLYVKQKTYTPYDVVETPNGRLSIDSAIAENFTTSVDLYLNTELEVLATTPLSTLDVKFVYDRGKMPNSKLGDDPEFLFSKERTRFGDFSDNMGILDASFTQMRPSYRLDFTMLSGALIDEETKSRMFPIEILDARGVDVNGNSPNFIFINGGIELTDISSGIYLAKELSAATPLSNALSNDGFIITEENEAFIRMYDTRESVRANREKTV